MIEKVDTHQPPIDSGASFRQPSSAGVLGDKDADVSVQVNYASFIDMALQRPQTDTQLVQRARELLLSGQLESEENTREAAENVIESGI